MSEQLVGKKVICLKDGRYVEAEVTEYITTEGMHDFVVVDNCLMLPLRSVHQVIERTPTA